MAAALVTVASIGVEHAGADGALSTVGDALAGPRSGAWLRREAEAAEAAEERRRVARLLLRLPQLEQESSLPLITTHVPARLVLAAASAAAPAPYTPSHPGPPAVDALLGADPLSVPSLRVRRQGGVVIVTINRASHANAYDGEMLAALETLIATLTVQRGVQVRADLDGGRPMTLPPTHTPFPDESPNEPCRLANWPPDCRRCHWAGPRLRLRRPAILLRRCRPRARRQPARRGRTELALAASLRRHR